MSFCRIVKDVVVSPLVWITCASLVMSCAPTSDVGNTASDNLLPKATEATQPSPLKQSSNLEENFGVQVTAKSLCSDGTNTILVLQTELDPEFWQLKEIEFSPYGQTYYETSILFLENNAFYSSVSSGKREEPVFDSETQKVSTVQTFVFPKSPLANSEFTIKAKVTLGNLPEAYVPPIGVNFMEPGIIEIPMEFVESGTLGDCP